MQTVVLQSNTKTDLKLLTDLARKIGVEVKYLSDEETEDLGLLKSIKKGRTKEYVDTEKFIDSLRK